MNNENVFEISTRLKQRFCKDLSVPIQVFSEPAFTRRIKLFGYEGYYEIFCNMLKHFNNEEEYFAFYNKAKEDIITYIKSSETYNVMNADIEIEKQNRILVGAISIPETNEIIPLAQQVSKRNVYNENNIGKTFVSIDLAKANFSSMVHYSIKHNLKEKFNDESFDWNHFLAKFVDKNHPAFEYLSKSKYIRQVVFGNCNVSRQIAYERNIINNLRRQIAAKTKLDEKCIRVVCDDELVYEVNSDDEITALYDAIHSIKLDCPIHFNAYILERIRGTKEGYALSNYYNPEDKEFKCVNSVEMVYVYTKYKCLENTVDDRYIFTEYGPAQLLEDIEITFEKDKAN